MIAAIIQARMGSTRLPGKSLADVCGKPMLERVVERVRTSSLIDDVVIATTTEKRDDVLVEFAERLRLKSFRGSEDDVLDRFYQTARHYAIRTIVRVTPDCPLLDPRVMDRVIELYCSGDYDYVSNTQRRRFPDGLDVEVFSFDALALVWKEAERPSDREHVTSYIRNNAARFRIASTEAPVDLSGFKWSVDGAEDLAFVRVVYERLGQDNALFYLEDVLKLLREVPELSRTNHDSVVNEGYYRSLVNDPAVLTRTRSLRLSATLGKKAQALIPGGSQTFSKGPTQFVQGVAPAFLVRGNGCRVWDVDGNEYLDCAMGLGSVVLGYCDPEVEDAVRRQLADGVSFSLPHSLELELAEALREIIPCAEMVRFGKNGSDATSGAIRAARAYTGRDIVACCGYHGWQDWYIGTTTRNRGVPEAVRRLTVPFAYNDIESLRRVFADNPGRVAAVIMEPVGVVEPREGFLQEVQILTRREGALLIFDEVLTGFRFSLGGAQEHFGVIPDLACFGKAMASGFPLSAVVGRGVVMELFEEVFFSFTFGGEALSLAATVATIEKMRRENVVGHLWVQGRKLRDGYNVLARHFDLGPTTECIGLPPRTMIDFRGKDQAQSLILKSLFQQECLKRGVLFTGAHNPSYSHGDSEVDQVLRVYRSAMEILAEAVRTGDAVERLEGKPLEPVFRQA